MKQITKKEHNEVLIGILKYIDEVCRENNIKYTLIGGSLIGTIRHQGIIPWDDDIDIALIKSEYDKLIEVLKKSTNEQYKLLNHSTNSSYYMNFSKIIDLRTSLKEECCNDISDYGIYVDIFCYYNTPNNKILRNIHGSILKFEKNLLTTSYKEKKYNNILFNIGAFIARFIGSNFWYILLNKTQNLYNKNNKSKYVVSNWMCYSLKKEIKERDLFKKYKYSKFENIDVMIIEKYDKFLRGTFGDYMQLPPEEKRVAHQIENEYWK